MWSANIHRHFTKEHHWPAQYNTVLSLHLILHLQVVSSHEINHTEKSILRCWQSLRWSQNTQLLWSRKFATVSTRGQHWIILCTASVSPIRITCQTGESEFQNYYFIQSDPRRADTITVFEMMNKRFENIILLIIPSLTSVLIVRALPCIYILRYSQLIYYVRSSWHMMTSLLICFHVTLNTLFSYFYIYF
jgi:hypothetical protein